MDTIIKKRGQRGPQLVIKAGEKIGPFYTLSRFPKKEHSAFPAWSCSIGDAFYIVPAKVLRVYLSLEVKNV